jgi:methylated-DNA-protein-cysteine methyltransferase-like protein
MTRRARAAAAPFIGRRGTHLSGVTLAIWSSTRRIPRGHVSTYGTIAALAGFSGQGRLAGYALHNLPAGANVPWHRVINAAGMISLRGTAGELQRRLLKEEGVVFDGKKIDLAVWGWPRTSPSPRGGTKPRHNVRKEAP